MEIYYNLQFYQKEFLNMPKYQQADCNNFIFMSPGTVSGLRKAIISHP